MLDDFLVRAVLAGIAVAFAAAPLGCFVVWRRMAYFGDATAHAAILGVALAIALGQSVFLGTLFVALAMALAISALSGRGLATDTLLGAMSHGALALGLVAVSLIGGVRFDLMSFLFGDILAVSPSDLGVIWGGAAGVLLLMAWRWQALLTATLSPDLAHAAGIDPRREQLVLTLALALVVATAIKVVGVLLIAAILIIPAAAARPLSDTPGGMARAAAAIGVASVVLGMMSAFRLDTPAGPTIVTAAAAIFVLSGVVGSILQKRT